MISRIREVRKGMGLTLADVAQKCVPPTTAQTIGRLETGTRTVSLDWLERIAAALGVDSGQLVVQAGEPEIMLVAELRQSGAEALSRREVLPQIKPDHEIMAMRVRDGLGDYRSGDMVWLRRVSSETYPDALNRDVLVPRPAGRFAFGRLIAHGQGRMQILPPGAGQRQQIVSDPPWLGVAEKLIRQL